MTVHVPCPEYPLHEPFMTGTSDMVRDFIVATLLNSLAHSSCNVIKHTVPAHSIPFATTSFSRAFHWIEHSVGILNLVERRRTFCTVSASTCRMIRIADQLAHRHGLLVNISQKSTTCLTIETGCRNNHILF